MAVITNSAAETRELGTRLAEKLKTGDVILLEGELGAGKSELARGVARGLGVTETVTSPSFTILNVYESGRIPLYHFDWYRLESAEELYELGMDEYLGGLIRCGFVLNGYMECQGEDITELNFLARVVKPE